MYVYDVNLFNEISCKREFFENLSFVRPYKFHIFKICTDENVSFCEPLTTLERMLQRIKFEGN
jgi:hypothetical protein